MAETHNSSAEQPPHVAVFPSAGLGHVTANLRVAAMFASRGCKVTIITAEPTVSTAESAHLSTFFSTNPQIKRVPFEVPPCEDPQKGDPYFLRWEAISSSAHLLRPLLSSISPPITALFSDITLLAATVPVTDDLGLPNYAITVSTARFLALLASLPLFKPAENDSAFKIPGLDVPLPLAYFPPLLLKPESIFCSRAVANGRALTRSAGLFINTFDAWEPETISAFKSGRVISNLPPVYQIGPFKTWEIKKNGGGVDDGEYFQWLDKQAVGSVVYVCFGNRTATSGEQIREIGKGLERSGCQFFWALKATVVDKEDKDDISELLGDDFLERVTGKGIIARGWVNQQEILSHPAVGGFFSHCGSNSILETVRLGLPILGWPLGGDQRITGEVVEAAGIGRVFADWGWAGEKLVSGEEIGEKVWEIMSDEKLKAQAKKIGEEARKAWEPNGCSELALTNVIDQLKQKKNKKTHPRQTEVAIPIPSSDEQQGSGPSG